MTTKAVRPVTGHMLIGGDFYQHTGYGVDRSWLAGKNPAKSLFTERDFTGEGSTEGIGARFMLSAMRAPLPLLLLDLPMHRENGAIKMSQGLTVLYLPEGKPWSSAVPVHVFNWYRDIIVNGEWRLWDQDWFLGCIRDELTSELREHHTATRTRCAEITRTKQILGAIG